MDILYSSRVDWECRYIVHFLNSPPPPPHTQPPKGPPTLDTLLDVGLDSEIFKDLGAKLLSPDKMNEVSNLNEMFQAWLSEGQVSWEHLAEALDGIDGQADSAAKVRKLYQCC